MITTNFRFSQLSSSWKVLISGFIIVINTGYLNGALNAALSVGFTPASIADHYGDQTLSEKEKAMVEEKGFVEEEVNLGEEGGANNKEEHKVEGHDTGNGGKSITLQEMAQMAHVHLLGFSLILISIGTLACLTLLSEWLKVILVGILSFSFLSDIAGLYLVRFATDKFAWLPVISGTTIGVIMAFISIRVLWELWHKV
ncbi:MAG: hypothetical protein HZA12_00930 [Nitrospirae bacterium]|nr:hypothetical protein [Nitrospirota bacterium]